MEDVMKKMRRNLIVWLLSIIMAVTMISMMDSVTFAMESSNTDYGISNPTRDEHGTVSWDCIYFGNYQQSADVEDGFVNEPIKWRVLSVNGDEALLLADKILTSDICYHSLEGGATWEYSTIRYWLNNEFINDAFKSTEQNAIITKKIKNDANPESGKGGTSDTSDKIFLLSVGEVTNTSYGFGNIYQNYDVSKEAKNTEYAIAQMNKWGEVDLPIWWLRTTGDALNRAATVRSSGYIHMGETVDVPYRGIRPALYLDLTANRWSKAGTVSSDGTVIESIENYDVSLSETDYPYDGTAKTPEVTIEKLIEGKDFKVSYTDNMNAGTATVTITGIGNYMGTIRKNFTISVRDISNNRVRLSETDYTYDGTAKTPEVTIGSLLEGRDFEVSYTNNTNAGTATVTITGIGSCKGTTKETFRISRGDIAGKISSLSKTEYSYDGIEKKPRATVKGLEEGKDFTVSYSNNTKAGTAIANIIGKGNYIGSITLAFTITPVDISGKTASLSKKKYGYDGTSKKPQVTIKGLKVGKDFTVSYLNNTNTGSSQAVIVGKGNYTGIIIKNFTIKKATPKVKASRATKTVKYKSVRKKATYTTAVAVTGAKGSKSFYKTGGSKKLTISKKTGKIKVKKGTRKGTYSIKIKVISAATENYKAKTSAIVKIKVKVK